MTTRFRSSGLVMMALAIGAGCDGNFAKVVGNDGGTSGGSTGFADLIPPDAFGGLKQPGPAHDELCANDGMHPNFPDDADKITSTFCQDLKPGGVMPTPKSLADLQKQLGLAFVDANGGNAEGGNPGFVLSGQSSALTLRSVSAVNPRAFVFTPAPVDGGAPPKDFTVLSFTRGDQFAEVAANDPTLNVVNLYLVRFDQVCNNEPGGCTNADMLTSRLETGWSNVRVYESSTSLNDTVADCLQCHQPNANGTKFLRMQENVAPYTHFFSAQTAGGSALLADYTAAHGTEDYGPVPGSLIAKSDPAKFAALVAQAGFSEQPNAFDSAAIESEVSASNPQEPVINVPPGKSLTWQVSADIARSGDAIAVPYHDVKITDPAKLSTATAAIQGFLSGSLAADQFPDIRDTFLDSANVDIGVSEANGVAASQLFKQTCRQCHNSSLDQTLSRARFNVDALSNMSADEKAAAVTRLNLPDSSGLKMPPVVFRKLTDDQRALLISTLQN